MTSSLTPAMVLNSWLTSRICTDVTAAPSRDESSTRRRALPSVTPYPARSGLASYLPYVSVSSSSTDSIWAFSNSIMGWRYLE